MKTLTPNTKKTTLNLNFDHTAPPLLDQLDKRLTLPLVTAAATAGYKLLDWAADQCAESQALFAQSMSRQALSEVDTTEMLSIASAVVAAAILTAAKLGPSTPSERIRLAATMLSERYQADW